MVDRYSYSNWISLLSPWGYVSNSSGASWTTWCVRAHTSPHGGLRRSFLWFHILLSIWLTLVYFFSLNNMSTVCFCLSLFLHLFIISLSLFCFSLAHATKKCCRSSSCPHNLHIVSCSLFLLWINYEVLILHYLNNKDVLHSFGKIPSPS